MITPKNLIKLMYLLGLLFSTTAWVDKPQWRYNTSMRANESSSLALHREGLFFYALDTNSFSIDKLTVYREPNESTTDQVIEIKFSDATHWDHSRFFATRPFIQKCKQDCMGAADSWDPYDERIFPFIVSIEHRVPSQKYSGLEPQTAVRNKALARFLRGPNQRIYLELLDSAGFMLFELTRSGPEMMMFDVSTPAIDRNISQNKFPRRTPRAHTVPQPVTLLQRALGVRRTDVPVSLLKVDVSRYRSRYVDDNDVDYYALASAIAQISSEGTANENGYIIPAYHREQIDQLFSARTINQPFGILERTIGPQLRCHMLFENENSNARRIRSLSDYEHI